MYLKYSTKVKVGMTIFVSVISALIILFFTIGMSLDSETTDYKIIFKNESVNGLTAGSFIKLLGVQIGTVKNIKLSKDDISSIVVNVVIDKSIKLKKDMYATMNVIGITGLKYIEITGGTNSSEVIKSGGYISSKKSKFADIADKMETMSYKVTELLTNLTEMTGIKNREKFSSALANLDKLTRVTSNFSEKVTPKLEQSISNLNVVLLGTDNFLKELNPVIKDVKKISSNFSKDENIDKMDNILESSDKMVDKSSQTLEELKNLVKNMSVALNEKNSSITELMKSMETISINFEEFSDKINRNPSLILRGDAENENVGR